MINKIKMSSIINSEGRSEITIEYGKPIKTIVFLADGHNNFDYINEFVDIVLSHPDWGVIITGDLWDAAQYHNHPTVGGVPITLEESVKKMKMALTPIYPQIIAFVWGGHEQKCFKSASGKGSIPNPFTSFFDDWQRVNPNAVVCEPMRSLIVNINGYRMFVKHGISAGKNFGVMEYRELLTNNEDVDIFVLSHLHIPMYIAPKRNAQGNSRQLHLIRTTAGISFAPYQDEKNLFASPQGMTRITFSKKLQVELI